MVRCILSNLLHSPDSGVKRSQRFALVEKGNIVLLLPWPIALGKRKDEKQRDNAQKYLEKKTQT